MNDYMLLLAKLVTPGALAPEFDDDFYRSTQVDLATFDTPKLQRHYQNHGLDEGRIASPAAHRVGFLAQIPRGPDQRILEIGPAVRPTLVGDDVRYFEISDRDELIARAQREGYDASRCPQTIHYVSPTADLDIVESRSFDTVFSSHCIEHQPDMIRHLVKVSRVLKPGGRYYLMIPDKRFCFDALLPESTFEAVRTAFDESRTVHTLQSVIEHMADTTHNDPERHWRGDSADPRAAIRAERQAMAEERFRAANGGYVDVHAWQFTPASFRAIIDAIAAMAPPGFTLRAERVYQTVYGSNEFAAVLQSID